MFVLNFFLWVLVMKVSGNGYSGNQAGTQFPVLQLHLSGNPVPDTLNALISLLVCKL